MKKIAVISLIVMLLSGQFAYAQCQCEELNLAIERAQRGELTPEEVESLNTQIINSILENKVEPTQGSLTCVALLWCVWSTFFISYGIYFLPCLVLFAAYCT
jgi:hypothetical protein